MNAYDDQTVFDNGNQPAYPHITYESAGGGYLNSTTLSASLWNKTTSWTWLKQKSEEIRKAIGHGGVTIKTDDGIIWIKLPYATRFSEPLESGDDTVKRMHMSIEVDFMTT